MGAKVDRTGWEQRGKKNYWSWRRGALRFSSGTADFKEATRLRDRWLDTNRQRQGITDISFEKWIELYRQIRSGKRSETERGEDVTYNQLAAKWRGRYLSSIGRVDIMIWLKEEREKGTARTCNKKRSHLRTLLKEAVACKYLTELPELPPRYKEDDSKERPAATPEIMAGVLRYAAGVDRDFYLYVAILVYAGCRANEAVSLTWENINLKDGHLTVEAGTAKNRRKVVKPLNSVLSGILRELPGITGKVLRRSYWRYNELMGEAMASVGVTEPGLKAHYLRHGFGTLLSQGGASLPDIAAALGHSKPSDCTRRYTHAVAEGVAKAVEGINLDIKGGKG